MSMPLAWQDERTDGYGVRSRALLFHGAVLGTVIQFPENAPTTYANVGARRLGPQSSWDEAVSRVEAEARRIARQQ